MDQPDIPANRLYSVPSQNDIDGILRSHCNGSSKLGYILQIVANLVVMKEEKMLIFVSLPVDMEHLEKVCKVYAQSLSVATLTESFS